MIKIDTAQQVDAPFLPDIERSSGKAFRQLSHLAWIADDDVQSVERHLELIRMGHAWVAKSMGRRVGFLNAERFDKSLHIWQMSVHTDFQKRGIGRALIAVAKNAAVSAGLRELTLTTFRDVAWNEPFYASCGFTILTVERLSDHLKNIAEAEGKAGLPLNLRCAMSCPVF